jgi:hypothetical protein
LYLSSFFAFFLYSSSFPQTLLLKANQRTFTNVSPPAATYLRFDCVNIFVFVSKFVLNLVSHFVCVFYFVSIFVFVFCFLFCPCLCFCICLCPYPEPVFLTPILTQTPYLTPNPLTLPFPVPNPYFGSQKNQRVRTNIHLHYGTFPLSHCLCLRLIY